MQRSSARSRSFQPGSDQADGRAFGHLPERFFADLGSGHDLLVL